MEIEKAYKDKELNFASKKEYITENILQTYGKMAAERASTPISISQSSILIDLEIEMSLKILNIWELDKYNVDVNYLLNEIIFDEKEKFIYRILLGKILRLIPKGVTIISVGIDNSLAKRFTEALGYAISELCSSYINLVVDKQNINLREAFKKEAIEDLMENYLIEYNKTVLN